MKRAFQTILAVVCIVIITLCAALVVRKAVGRSRIDLTARNLYTLSEGTRNILGKLGQPTRLTLYYSRVAAMKGPEDIRYYNNYYIYVRDLLDEYVNLARGQLTLSISDPRPYTEEEEEAIRHGVQRFPLSENENFFFGLVAVTELGKEKVIPFFEPQRQEFVEYDISKLISSVTRRDNKKVGVLSSLPVMGNDLSPYMMQMLRMQGRTPDKPWTIIEHLREEYEVVSVTADTDSVESDMDFLMVVHPKELPEKTLFAIDQYVMKGGKLLAFVDPHCLSDLPTRDPRSPYVSMDAKSSSDLNKLLHAWGVKLERDLIAGDRALALKASLRPGGPIAPVVTALDLNENCVNTEEVLTADLHSLRMLFPGVLEKVDGTQTTVTPLLTTTKTGGTWRPGSPFELRMPDPEVIRRAMEQASEPVMLACRISGKLKTNFPDGLTLEEGTGEIAAGSGDESEKEERKTAKIEAIKEASPDAAVLVFADVDMISDIVAYTDTFFGLAEIGDNASVVFNALDFLGGSSDLISIRSRGRFSRPFVVVDEIEAQAEKETATEVEAIRKRIAEYREDLQELAARGSGEDVKLIRNTVLAKRKKIEEEMRKAETQLRKLNAVKLEKIEALKASLLTHNIVWAPTAVLLIAIVLAAVRAIKAKRYAARRMQ